MTSPRSLGRLRQEDDRGSTRGIDRPVWDVDGAGWPNRAASRFVQASGLRWHVQVQGSGPVAFLVHGTGAATHSWAGLAPLMARRFTVIAVDLPGHGFTQMPAATLMSLPAMAQALDQLLAVLDAEPALAVGHSAGAAILCRMALDGNITPERIVSLNGALLPFRGLPGQIFSPMARLAAGTSLLPRLFAWHASFDRRVVERLIRDTGSRIDGPGLEMHRQLAKRPGHVAAALAMMAHWDLEPLSRDLPKLAPSLMLVTGARDRAIPPSDARRIQALLPTARIVALPQLGHLAHEERPQTIAELIMEWSGSPELAAQS